jgi:hypothetical protein
MRFAEREDGVNPSRTRRRNRRDSPHKATVPLLRNGKARADRLIREPEDLPFTAWISGSRYGREIALQWKTALRTASHEAARFFLGHVPLCRDPASAPVFCSGHVPQEYTPVTKNKAFPV